MTDTTSTQAVATANAAAEAAKPKTVLADMDQRRFFPTVDDARNYITKCAADFADFNDLPIAAQGVSFNEATNSLDFDPAIYNDTMRVMIAVTANQGAKGADGKRAPSTVKAIVVTPAPTLDTIMGDEAGRAWLGKIADTELNHIAVRQIRGAADPATVADQMPKTLAEYLASGREGTGGIVETFNTLYKELNVLFQNLSKPWARARMTKPEIKNALQSKAFALDSQFSNLEDRPAGSLFEMFLKLGIDSAKEQGLDPTIFERWLETRAEKVIDAGEQTDEDEDDSLNDLDALRAKLAAAKTEKPAEGDATNSAGAVIDPAAGTPSVTTA